MPFSVYARGDSSTANNASLNAQSTSQVPTTLLTFEAAAGGDETLEFNNGSPDPDTVVYVDGDTSNPLTFTLEFGGFLPQTNKLADVNGVDLRGEEILVLTLSNGDRYFFLKNSDGTMTWFDIMDDFPNGAHSIENTYTCYAAGTMIDTPAGPCAVETLRVGDQVLTNTGRPVIVRHVVSRDFTATEIGVFAPLRPLILPAGSITAGVPSADLTVSALHRILVRDSALEQLFGLEAAFVVARDLPWSRPAPITKLTYVHFLCDAHQCVIANGCESESLYPGDVALGAVPPEDSEALRAVFDDPGRTAYPCLTAREAEVWRAAIQSREKRTA